MCFKARASDVDLKLNVLRRLLRDMERVLIAFSGGVDSSFLLRVAGEELGDRVVALTTRSPTAPEDDLVFALSFAEELGVRHLVLDANELEIPEYAANPTNRCYFCKDRLYEICHAEAERLGIEHIADGVNLDDLGDYRPGLQAAREHHIRHPLVEAELSKAEIRAFSRALGLPTWDRPSSPCLSSRFPYGTAITLDALRKVGGAERVLRQLGFRECRVRYHESVARIEVVPEEIARLTASPVREIVLRELRAFGFRYVAVDLQGYRTGSLNEGLVESPGAIPPTPDRLAS
jgi:uncharacterized protein